MKASPAAVDRPIAAANGADAAQSMAGMNGSWCGSSSGSGRSAASLRSGWEWAHSTAS